MSTPQRTYWHLEGLRRVPTEYDIASSRLLYQPTYGSAVDTPVSAWLRRHATGSVLGRLDWERFRDPRETTYARYTALQHERETFVDGLFRVVDETGYDQRLASDWLQALEKWLPVLLYPCHALQMTAAYVAQLAPGGRIVMAAMFQAADEMRRIQRIAARTRQLAASYPNFGRAGKREWQEQPCWQPLRKSLEKLLITYDFDEALLALTLVYKPLFDGLWMHDFARLADSAGDPVLAKLFFSFDEDCRWHRAWSHALIRLALEDGTTRPDAVHAVLARHHALAHEAFAALAPLWTSPRSGWQTQLDAAESARRASWSALGIPVEASAG